MTTRTLLTIGFTLALLTFVHAQDGLRSASLPERPIATPPPGPGDLFRATPGTYRPHNDINRPRPELPHTGRGSRPPGRGHLGSGGGWPYVGWGYWPYYEMPGPPQANYDREAVAGGYLQVQITPPDAAVYIDGSFAGSAADLRQPGTRLDAGSHRVRLEASGYQERTFDVRIADGETVTYRQSLDREVPARAPASPVARAQPKTMYVIPNCYAGDRPPSPATGCDLKQLRTLAGSR